MAEMQGRDRDFVLAPNEFLFIQDRTKGLITVYVGPHKNTLSETDTPILFAAEPRKFEASDLQRAIQQHPSADEGWYITLENPATDEKQPESGQANNLAKLRNGCKVNIPGPRTFPLWPGQVANVIQGHHLRTNQYLVVRVYNDEEARRNWSQAVVKPAGAITETPNPDEDEDKTDGETKDDKPKKKDEPKTTKIETSKDLDLTMGKLLIIKGTEVSFYIPPTGVEVVPDPNSQSFVREAVTLERLEYCILKSESGNKRYVKGPNVVFPEPTETFTTDTEGSPKFRAIELNDDMGLYIKVTADYEDDNNRKRKAGEELFITGKDQRLYFPRAEHSIITYGEKEVHYGVAIPEGEARYVLNKQTGSVRLEKGPQIFLPDPRKQVIVRRVLSENEVSLWFPGNVQALEYNAALRRLATKSRTLEEAVVSTSFGTARSGKHRQVATEEAVMAFAGDKFDRGTAFTPPRTITLNTKFEGAVSINIWNGYAVMVVDKNGKHRVETGPKTVLLQYDETLQVLALSKGKPKTTDDLEHTVYLRQSFNQVSDVVRLVTRDMVHAEVKLSYRVNFEGKPEKWFSVENYVKFLCDHARSLLRSAAKRHTIEELNQDYISIIRDTILGESTKDGPRPGRLFEENGVRIYDIEVSGMSIGDVSIGSMLAEMQQNEVRRTLEVTSRDRELAATKRIETIERAIATEKAETDKHSAGLRKSRIAQEAAVATVEFEAEQAEKAHTAKLEEATQKLDDFVSAARLLRQKAIEDQQLEQSKAEQTLQVELLKSEADTLAEKAKAITPDLIAALQSFGDRDLGTKLAVAMAPMSILGGENIADVLQKFLGNTAVSDALKSLSVPTAAAAALTARALIKSRKRPVPAEKDE